jgi:hypothetical protein
MTAADRSRGAERAEELVKDETPVAANETDPFERLILGRYDVPAYVRRARGVQDGLEAVLARCRAQREEWLSMVRLRVGELFARAGNWEALRPLLADDEQLDHVRNLHDELRPMLRVSHEPTRSASKLRRILHELIASLERFNRRWLAFLPENDLSEVNALRDSYNRYYILEKECAVRSPAVARMGFQRLEPLTTDDLRTMLPSLPVPKLAVRGS